MATAFKRPPTDVAESSSTDQASKRPRLPEDAEALPSTQSAAAPSAAAPSAASSAAASSAAAPIAAAAPAAAASDELIAAAPKLAAAIRSAAKCAKVAEKVASLFEENHVKPFNAGAVFDVLSAAMEDPTSWRQPSRRVALRRLFTAAAGKLVLFPLHQQQSIQVWKARVVMQVTPRLCCSHLLPSSLPPPHLLSSSPPRVVMQVDLLSSETATLESAFLELTMLLRRLPCDNPADEPRSSAQVCIAS